MKVLDVSIYDFSTFDAECFAANDVGRLIVGTSNYSAAKTMVTQARDAGIIVDDLYGFIYYGLGWESRDARQRTYCSAQLQNCIVSTIVAAVFFFDPNFRADKLLCRVRGGGVVNIVEERAQVGAVRGSFHLC